jgi:hypothetical protein
MKAVRFFLFVTAAVSLSMAASDSLMSYYDRSVTAYPAVIGQHGPYNYVANVDLSSTNWTAPAGVTIMMIKACHAGAIVAKTWTDSCKLFIAAPGDVEWVDARKIYRVGTTADSIVVYGKR